jgi:hypothetical protein
MVPAFDTESLKLIQETAVKAAGNNVKDRVCVREQLPDKTKWLLINKDGGHSLHDVSQPLRLHKLLSVQEVVAFAVWAKSEDGLNSKPIVWIGHEQIVVTLDDRRLFADRAIYEFRPTDEWELLNKLSERTDGLDQRAFLRMLRVDFAECFARDEQRLTLINLIRKVRAQQTSNIGNGSGSYDASLGSAANEEMVWPESLDLSVCVFDDPSLTLRQTVRCAFDVEPQPPRFVLSPLTAHIARALGGALELASDCIRAELKNNVGCPVFLGQPE